MSTTDGAPTSFTFTTFAPDDGIYKDIQHSLAHASISTQSNAIRRSTRTLKNRLKSIRQDANFVLSVAEAYNLPLVTNSRAGDWYVDPGHVKASVYFKSTDGHTWQWSFSTRRLNLKLLEVIAGSQRNGYGHQLSQLPETKLICGSVVIVDSTRRGKRFPDSLAKTVPIWIAVVNRILFPGLPIKLHVTPLAVSKEEVYKIEQRLPGFVDEFLKLGLDISHFKKKIAKPMRPLFVCPESTLPLSPPDYDDFIPVVLVSASRRMEGGGMEGEYIQGAGDDHEGWASESGLTPALFWENVDAILSTSDDKLLHMIKALPPPAVSSTSGSLIAPTRNIYLASTTSLKGGSSMKYGCVVNCTKHPISRDISGRIIDFPLDSGKKSAKDIRLKLETLLQCLEKPVSTEETVVFVCETGDEVAPVITLACLCRYFDENGKKK